MDEPLLGTSACLRITRKSEHPFLSILSTSPSPRATTSPRAYDSLSSFLDNEQGRRTEKFYVCPPKSPQFVRREPFTAESFKASVVQTPGLSGLTTLFRIPEDELAGCPSSSCAVRAGQVDDDGDLESLLSQRKHDRNNEGADDNNTGIFGEPLTDDLEEGKGEKGSWKTSRVTGLLFSALPEVLNPFSSSREDDLPVCGSGDCRADNGGKDNDEIHWTKSGLSGLIYSTMPTLPDLIHPFSSIEDDVLLDHRALGALPGGLAKKSDSQTSSMMSLDGLNFEVCADKRKRSLHRCRTAPMLNGCSIHTKVEPHTRPIRTATTSASSVVWHASVGLCMYLCVGVLIYNWRKDDFGGIVTVGVVDGLYFCIVTMCTIGYGDITPITPSAKILACALVFVGFGFIDALMSGMVTFVLDRQEHLLLAVVEDGHHETAKNYVMDAKKGRMRIRMKVALAIATVLMTITVGVVFLHQIEDLNWIDALYVTCISITTVGYGDVSFQTTWGRLFAAVWLLLSTLGVARAFLFLAEARVHRRHRHLARRVLQRKMTTNDLMSMDLDNDGHISKSEFVVYKLKEMGKIEEGDVVEICKQFDFLDHMCCGKITLAQLLEGEE